ncbi:Inositolphosphorylceramide synthase subunit Kei1-domain-containing protein [Chaetomium strumarium]|uniref:Inositolphosphorylceramide synthase subunit Kei1-domain-containing protein n=1 Tax=Chaetomium strumarium TaxID=1170767 RepID=A0AAJ0GWZ7_9PEZI|nr:Inositolphosphorylceramide synthase subunit Kei1-domain-containing protein [Chaetomium strumarium]
MDALYFTVLDAMSVWCTVTMHSLYFVHFCGKYYRRRDRLLREGVGAVIESRRMPSAREEAHRMQPMPSAKSAKTETLGQLADASDASTYTVSSKHVVANAGSHHWRERPKHTIRNALRSGNDIGPEFNMPSIPKTSWLRVPRPRSFLGLLSLQTGTELISVALVFNKATGVYGLLTLFTGYSLSALQVTAYLGSILVLVALALCVPHIRKQSPLQNLALAWVYAIDTVVSAAYTTAFATSWYLALRNDPTGPAGHEEAPGTQSANGQVRRDGGQAKAAAGVEDTAASMVLIVAFSLVRVYFSLVVMAYARMVLLRFVDERMADAEDVSGTTADPFAVGAPLGEGWRGQLGRAMVSVGRGYWLGGKKEDEEWARRVKAKFRSTRE